jgi:outer membrane protein assembly factor BamB
MYAFPASCGTGDATCFPLWQGAAGSDIDTSPAVADGVVYAGSYDHHLYAWDLAAGSPAAPRPVASDLRSDRTLHRQALSRR